MKFGALLVAGVAAYEQEWAEFQAVQGQRNGDVPAEGASMLQINFVAEESSVLQPPGNGAPGTGWAPGTGPVDKPKHVTWAGDCGGCLVDCAQKTKKDFKSCGTDYCQGCN